MSLWKRSQSEAVFDAHDYVTTVPDFPREDLFVSTKPLQADEARYGNAKPLQADGYEL